jgi:hypothetical protein
VKEAIINAANRFGRDGRGEDGLEGHRSALVATANKISNKNSAKTLYARETPWNKVDKLASPWNLYWCSAFDH